MDTTKAQMAADLLANALEYIEKGWTQNAYARNGRDDNQSVEADDLRATCWCALGALRRAELDTVQPDQEQEQIAVNALAKTATGAIWTPRGDIAEWNDKPGRTQGEVVLAFQRAIEYLRSDAQRTP